MVSEELERNVRNICKITWNDGETDDRVSSIAENAVAHIHDLLGMPGEPAEADFLKPGTVRILFENYCLYCWNEVPDEFEKNYLRDILKARRKYEGEAARNE